MTKTQKAWIAGRRSRIEGEGVFCAGSQEEVAAFMDGRRGAPPPVEQMNLICPGCGETVTETNHNCGGVCRKCVGDMPDIRFINHGSVWSMVSCTDAGREWIDANVQWEEWATLGDAIVADWRCAVAIANGAQAVGLQVEVA